MTRIAELRQQMAATHAQIETILAKSRDEKRSLNTEEQAAFDKASAEITGQLKTIEAEERAAEPAPDPAASTGIALAMAQLELRRLVPA